MKIILALLTGVSLLGWASLMAGDAYSFLLVRQSTAFRVIPFPISSPTDPSLTQTGQIVIVSASYSRAQVYNREAEFQYGFSVAPNTRSLYVDGDDVLHTYVWRRSIESCYSIHGELLHTRVMTRRQWMNQLATERRRLELRGIGAVTRSTLLGPVACITHQNGDEVRLRNPVWLLPFTPPFAFGFFCVLIPIHYYAMRRRSITTETGESICIREDDLNGIEPHPSPLKILEPVVFIRGQDAYIGESLLHIFYVEPVEQIVINEDESATRNWSDINVTGNCGRQLLSVRADLHSVQRIVSLLRQSGAEHRHRTKPWYRSFSIATILLVIVLIRFVLQPHVGVFVDSLMICFVVQGTWFLIKSGMYVVDDCLRYFQLHPSAKSDSVP